MASPKTGAASVAARGTVPVDERADHHRHRSRRCRETTVADEMGYALRDAGIPHATIDFDRLRACYPRPPEDDRWGNKLGLANLGALWKTYWAAGARRLLIACVIERRSDVDGFREAVPGADILLVRLRAAPETLQARVRRRSRGTGVEWDLNRAVELAALMDQQPVEDMLVETEGRNPAAIAHDILRRSEWISAERT